jgi:hypothetical protein
MASVAQSRTENQLCVTSRKDYSVHDMQGDLVNPIVFGLGPGDLRHKS